MSTRVHRNWTIASTATLTKRELGCQARKAVRDAVLVDWVVGEKSTGVLAEKHDVARRDVYWWVHRYRNVVSAGEAGS